MDGQICNGDAPKWSKL